METSHKKAWKCGHLHMYLFQFRLIEDMREILQIHESFTHSWESIELNGVQQPFTQVCLHGKTWKYRSRN